MVTMISGKGGRRRACNVHCMVSARTDWRMDRLNQYDKLDVGWPCQHGHLLCYLTSGSSQSNVGEFGRLDGNSVGGWEIELGSGLRVLGWV
jgi:hypothetical protein